MIEDIGFKSADIRFNLGQNFAVAEIEAAGHCRFDVGDLPGHGVNRFHGIFGNNVLFPEILHGPGEGHMIPVPAGENNNVTSDIKR